MYNNKEIEQAILGALLLEKDAFDEVATLLTPESFYADFHRVVYSAIAQLNRENKPVDYLAVGEIVSKHLPDPKTTTIYQLTQLTSHVASAANIKHHALILKDLQIKREILNTAQLLQKKAEGGAEADELSGILRKQVETIEENSVVDAPLSMKNALFDVVNELKQPDTRGLSTGFPGLDKFFGGLKPGRVYVLAARPGMGKTSVALFSAIANVQAGKQVLFFSAEMDVPDITKKLLAGQSGMGHETLDRGNLSANDWGKVDAGIARMQDFSGDMYIKDWPKNIQHIAAMIRNHKKKRGLHLVVIDYLQLIPGMKQGKYREQEVSEVSRMIKQIAMQEKIPVIALAQLNRQGIGEPGLHNLRESGAIEQDADCVMFIHRPAMDGNLEHSHDYGKILIKKNRRGITGDFEFYNRNMAEFSEHPFPEENEWKPF